MRYSLSAADLDEIPFPEGLLCCDGHLELEPVKPLRTTLTIYEQLFSGKGFVFC